MNLDTRVLKLESISKDNDNDKIKLDLSGFTTEELKAALSSKSGFNKIVKTIEDSKGSVY